MAGFWVRRLDELPLVPTDVPDDFDWYPQHQLGLGAEHDEEASDQEELCVVVEGSVAFTLDGETRQVFGVSFVAVPDPTGRRSAVAAEDGTLLLAIGAPRDSGFATTWNESNFGRVPRAE